MNSDPPSQTISVTSVIEGDAAIMADPIFTLVTLICGPLIPALIKALIPVSVITVFIWLPL